MLVCLLACTQKWETHAGKVVNCPCSLPHGVLGKFLGSAHGTPRPQYGPKECQGNLRPKFKGTKHEQLATISVPLLIPFHYPQPPPMSFLSMSPRGSQSTPLGGPLGHEALVPSTLPMRRVNMAESFEKAT